MDNEYIDIKSAQERFLGNFGLFSKFLYQFPEKPLFSELESAYKSGDVNGAFESAHTLKGVAGNLSLKLMTEPVSCVVEALRAGHLPTEEEWNELVTAYNRTVDYIAEIRKENSKLF